MIHIGWGCKKSSNFNLLIVLWPHGHGHKELGATHAVSYVVHLAVTRSRECVVNACSHIIETAFMPVKVPELLARLSGADLQGGVVPAVGVSPAVAHPNIISCISQDKAYGFLWRPEHPTGGRTGESMLKIDRWLPLLRLCFIPSPWYPVKPQNVSILSGHKVLLHLIAPVPYKIRNKDIWNAFCIPILL